MQPDTYQLDDFLSDASFRDWVRQGGLRQPDAHWTRYWHDHPVRQPLMRQAQNMLLAAHLTEETVAPEQTERFVRQTLAYLHPQPVRLQKSAVWRWAAAAAVVLLVGASGWFWVSLRHGITAETTPALVQTGATRRQLTNSTDRPRLVSLTDGSTVLLQPGATLDYPVQFKGPNREVMLMGEAFFRIAHNPKQPFLVLAGGMVTKVLGTSFSIRANEADPTVIVEVKTGRVAVFAQTELEQARRASGLSTRNLLVTPNQQVVFERTTGQMNRRLVEEPALLKIPDQNRDFVFTDVPVARVFATLETAYGVDIVFDADALQRCTLTAPLGNEPLFEKLNVICRAIGGRYEVVGAQVVVQSEGCDE